MDIRGFFATPSATTSTAYRQLLDVQTRTQNLYTNLSTMQPDQIERAIDGIVGSAREMVRRRQAEQTPVPVIPGLNILQRLNLIRERVETQQAAQGPPPMRTAPQIVPVRPPAELRPAARMPITNNPPRAPRAPRAPRPAHPVDWTIPKRSSRFKKLKVVPQEEMNTEAECNVCFEPHTKDKILTTDCKHNYCITCWSTWMRSTQSDKSCPTCRTICPPVTYYKAKAARRAPQRPITA
jgi:hypothetical protein